MATIQADAIKDLITTTQRELGELKFTELVSDIQEHVAMSELLKKNRVTFDSGTAIQWNLMMGHSQAAKEVGLFEVDSLDIQDQMVTANIPWRHVTVNYAIERRELAMNREPRRLVELIKIRRSDAMASMAELMEGRFWGRPATSDDNKRVFGVNYWVVHNGSSGDGFTGKAATGFTSVAGLNPDTYSRWRNWSAQTTALASDTDLNDTVLKWREAAVKTNFKPIPGVTNTPYGSANTMGYYTNYAVLAKLETRLENQNDNLGNDIAAKDGKVVFRGVPVTYVPYLDKSADNPIFGLNWGKFRPVFLSGEFMREMGPETAPNQHTTYVTHVDTTLNFLCYDRRRNFVLSSNATAGSDLGLG
ncbi:MAG: phage major capsid protein [Phycisphaerales bacterium]